MASRRRGSLTQTAVMVQIPAPTGGWNARDPLPEMATTDAVILENLIPGAGGVSLRGGSATRNAGAPGAVNSLLRYFPAAGLQFAFAVSGAGIYDVSLADIVHTVARTPLPFTTPVVTGLNSDKWQGVMFGTPGGEFLVAASGYDQPQIFNGTSWSAMTILAPNGYAYPFDPTKLMAPFVFGNRLYFVERGTLHIWFLPLYSIQATGLDGSGNRVQATNTTGIIPTTCAQVLDFSSQLTLGGSIVAMADWTRDGGTGTDDYAVIITSAGQVLIYSGDDPNSTVAGQAFALVGLFRIAPPIGTRCVIKAGADLAILTQTGAVPLSSVLALSESQEDEVALSDKIRGAFQNAYALVGQAFGWELAEYPKGVLLIVNVPQSGGTFQQFVMNVLTGAWCNFTGLNATTFSLLNDALIFGTSDGRVLQYDVNFQDSGQPISAICLPAFSGFKSLDKKRFLLARPLYFGALGYQPALRLAVEYDTARYLLPQGVIPSGGAVWGTAQWGTSWSAPVGQSSQWQGIRGVAQTASVLVNVVSNNPFRLDHIDVQFSTGGAF